MELATRGWWVAFCATVLVLVAGVLLTTDAPVLVIGLAVVIGYAAFWLAIGRRSREGDRNALALIIVTVLAAGALTAIAPVLAVFQFFAYPLVWTLSASLRASIVANVAIALAVTAGFLVSLGTEPDAVLQTIATESISLAFSLIMGLWITRIAQLGAERKVLLDELTAAQDELAVVHRDAGVVSERERMSRELHDTIAQSLTGLTLLTQRARRELAAGSLDDATLELIESGTRDALAETRAVVADSAPVELGGGLPDALARLGERISRESGLTVTTTTRIDRALDRDTEVVLLRCAQEGLANVRKHAAAAVARVELEVATDAALMRIVDDGRGFDPEAPSTGFGLSGLRDRLGLVGGTLDVSTRSGATTLTARLPLAAVSG